MNNMLLCLIAVLLVEIFFITKYWPKQVKSPSSEEWIARLLLQAVFGTYVASFSNDSPERLIQIRRDNKDLEEASYDFDRTGQTSYPIGKLIAYSQIWEKATPEQRKQLHAWFEAVT